MTESTSSRPPDIPLPPPKERRRLREARGLSQQAVAAAIGVTRATIRAWESGRSSPRGPRRTAYAELLGLPGARSDDAPVPTAPATGTGMKTGAGGPVTAPIAAAGADHSELAAGAPACVGVSVTGTDAGVGAGGGAGVSAAPVATETPEPAAPAPAVAAAVVTAVAGHPAGAPTAVLETTGPDDGPRAQGDPRAAGAREPAPPVQQPQPPRQEPGQGGPAPHRGQDRNTGPGTGPGPGQGLGQGQGQGQGLGTDTRSGSGSGSNEPHTDADADDTNTNTNTFGDTAPGLSWAPRSGPGSEAERTGPTPEHAFDTLYTRDAPALVRQTFLLTGRRVLSQAAVERAFHLAWQHWPEVARDRDPTGWTRAAAYEFAMSPWQRLRPAYRHPDTPPLEPGPRALLEALLALPPTYRRTVVLYDCLGLDLPETAAETEASTPATANRVLHAREALAGRLPELDSPEELRRRLIELADAFPEPELTPAREVREGSEDHVWFWTRTALAITALIVTATSFTLMTAPQQYEPGVPAGQRVAGVPAHAGPPPLTVQDRELRRKLLSEPAHGPERLVPQSR
ncbi:helix-turn-helix domain-containing protein [Streptomyces sp. NPDC057638]|uniref:helix-turn-helix domain-containing protein n=1 Tax=Streptomyces sp. NPDC057638 TaxID=3346190 RepID=UPI0036BDB7B8